MKRILGGFALSVVLAAPVMAADLPARPLPARAIPVVVAPVFNWTGCYVGAHFGYALSPKRVDFEPNLNDLDFDHNVHGMIIGGQVGCNLWQSDRWVLGIEGQAAWADMKEDVSHELTASVATLNGFRTKIDIIGSIAARLGYGIGPDGSTLLFVKGGAAFIREQYSTFGINNFVAQESDDRLRWGWMVGVGLEHAFNGNWSIKGEYNFSHFGNKDIDLCTPAGDCDTFRIRQHVHLFKFGFNYRFGGYARPAPVVTTRY